MPNTTQTRAEMSIVLLCADAHTNMNRQRSVGAEGGHCCGQALGRAGCEHNGELCTAKSLAIVPVCHLPTCYLPIVLIQSGGFSIQRGW